MKTKIVYILTSTPDDLYLEETWVSAFTARHYNPDASIVLVTDIGTAKTCETGHRKCFVDFFDEVKVIDASAWDGNMKRSRYLKTTLRQHIDGDYLFVDSDTVVCDDLSDIDMTDHSVAMVLDNHMEKSRQDKIYKAEDIKLWGRDADVDEYYNSGVIYVKDNDEAHSFYNLWHKHWIEGQRVGVNYDQPPLHRAIAESKIEIGTLSGVWNCQLWGQFLPFLHKAKIIHYSPKTTGPQVSTLTDRSFLQQVKEKGEITEAVARWALEAKSSFLPNIALIKGGQVDFANSDMYLDTLYLYKHHPRIFAALNRVKKLFMFIAAHSKPRS